MLSIPPNIVRSKTAIAKKKVLARIDEKDYARVEKAIAKQHPKEKDVEALAELLDDILDKALSGPRASDLVHGD